MNAIEVKNVSKSFKGYADRAVTLKEKLLFRKRRKYKRREVLKDISLTIEQGEVVGLIGENGCGKSTLLKLMTGILYPEAGSISTEGRVSSLLELGAGFHPDLSGRENVYINAAIFGLSKKETDERFQDILDFSELHEFIDNPVRTYSSGMYMRLAFSVAINVNADILLIDEILAVGDLNFQNKCFERLKQMIRDGITIVIVTHDIGVFEDFCTRAVWLNDGKIVQDGEQFKVAIAYRNYMMQKRVNLFANGKDFDQEDVYYVYDFLLGRPPENRKIVENCCNAYKDLDQLVEEITKSEEFHDKPGKLEFSNMTLDEIKSKFASFRHNMRSKREAVGEKQMAAGTEGSWNEDSMRQGNRQVEIMDAWFSVDGQRTDVLKPGDDVILFIDYTLHEEAEKYGFGFDINTVSGVNCFGSNMLLEGMELTKLEPEGRICCRMENLNLTQGAYYIDVYIMGQGAIAFDYIREYKSFSVIADDKATGIMSLRHEWQECQ